MIPNAPLLSPSHSNSRVLAFYPDTPLLSGLCHLDQWHVPPLLSTHLACLLYVSNTQRSRRRRKERAEKKWRQHPHTESVLHTSYPLIQLRPHKRPPSVEAMSDLHRYLSSSFHEQSQVGDKFFFFFSL